jgi:choice-of-anchor A domain-containing protein
MNNHWNLKIVLFSTGAIASLTILAPQAVYAASLGGAQDYNIFLFEDMVQSNTDSEGKVAVGGNLSLSNFAAGMNLSGNAEMLIVGKDLQQYQHGQVGKEGQGKVVYGGNQGTVSNVTHGGIQQSDRSAWFNETRTQLTSLSQQLASLGSNGSSTFQWGQLDLLGTDSDLNIFNIDLAQLNTANTFKLTAPGSSTVVVNFLGESAQWQNMGVTLQGITANRVLYNFQTATTLNLAGIGVNGSILAPQAALNFNNGQVNGQVIARSLSGSGQSNWQAFDGNLPDPQPVPTPSVLFGLVGMGIATWRKRQTLKQ